MSEEKKLIEQIHNLIDIKPDSQWKETNRNILLSQISNSVIDLNIDHSLIKFTALPQRIIKFISQPVLAALFIIFIISGFFSVRIAHNTKPGNSLYIAKVISEKAHLAITFNEEKKNKLSFKIASDHAKEITQVLANPDFNKEDDISKTEKLTQDFKKEIGLAKTRLKEINIASFQSEEDNNINNFNSAQEESYVFSANLSRDENGMQIEEEPSGQDSSIITENINETKIHETSPEEIASTTEDLNIQNSNDLNSAHKRLEEAEEFFDQEDYNNTLSKLEEADAIINNMNDSADDKNGLVQGVSEEATSTDEMTDDSNIE